MKTVTALFKFITEVLIDHIRILSIGLELACISSPILRNYEYGISNETVLYLTVLTILYFYCIIATAL